MSEKKRRGRKPLSPCPPGFYTAAQIRDRLGVSERQFRQLTAARVISASRYSETNMALYSEQLLQMLLNRQADGSLFSYRKEEDGTVVPVPQPLVVPTTYTPEQGVQVLEMLDQQIPILRIVLETKLLPQVVRRIQMEYDEMVGSLTIPKRVLDQMNKLPLEGSFPLRFATDILEIMQAALQIRACTTCERTRAMSVCSRCFKNQLAKSAATEVEDENGAATIDNEAQGHVNGSSTLPSGSQPSGSSQNIRQP